MHLAQRTLRTRPHKFSLASSLLAARNGVASILDAVFQGFFYITHHGLVFLGLSVLLAVLTLSVRPDWRQAGEFKLISWLEDRHALPLGVATLNPIERLWQGLGPANAKNLTVQQASVTAWLSKKYAVAPEPLGVLVAQAFQIGKTIDLDPTLILAVMAVESGFNPFAQSPVGAQGLMQVMTQVHQDKYASLGGKQAAFDPRSNLLVGVKVLQECIARFGSVESGLKCYVGAANLDYDGGYTERVLAEHARLIALVGGKSASTSATLPPPQPSASNKVLSLPTTLAPEVAPNLEKETKAEEATTSTLLPEAV